MHTSLLLYSFHLAVNKKVPIYINTAFKEYLSYSQFHSHCLSPDGEIPDRNDLLTTGSSRKLSHLTLIGSKFDHIISLQTLGTMLMHACTQKQYNGNYRHDQETLKQLKLVKRKKAQRSELTRELGNNTVFDKLGKRKRSQPKKKFPCISKQHISRGPATLGVMPRGVMVPTLLVAISLSTMVCPRLTDDIR